MGNSANIKDGTVMGDVLHSTYLHSFPFSPFFQLFSSIQRFRA